jgi:hypothetical protein
MDKKLNRSIIEAVANQNNIRIIFLTIKIVAKSKKFFWLLKIRDNLMQVFVLLFVFME